MKRLFRFSITTFLLFVFFLNGLPVAEACGPSYVSPIFDYKYAPENPFENFAAGKIGIVKPSYHRSVLFAAYRYLNGGGFNEIEQKSLVEVWNAEFNNQPYQTEDVGEAVKSWVEKRKEVVGKEEKLPEIYTERDYGGYDFFPNCTKSAFETAGNTLSERIRSYGSNNADVKKWLEAQDAVFTNCASGRQMPEPSNQTMPEWLQKDRAYQIAAAEFYSLNYEQARRLFAEIAQDSSSPWRETADYLVARTLIRQASLSKSEEKSNAFYAEAEAKLENLLSKGNKFSESAERLSGLVKYRLHPKERAGELARKLAFQSGNQNFRQDLIDYFWLLDKFEKESLELEEKRKEAEKPKEEKTEETGAETEVQNAPEKESKDAEKENLLSFSVYTDDYSQNWTITVKPEATDEEAFDEARKVAGNLTDKMKEQIRFARRTAYTNRYSENRQRDYQGGYYGTEEKSLSVLPEFLRQDDLTDWLYAFQIQNAESFDYAVSKFRQTDSDLWLMTALSKADAKSPELKSLFEASEKISRSSPVFPTVAFHHARILIENGKRAESRKLLNDILNSSIEMPVSSRNQFLKLRTGVAETLDDFLLYSQRKPFAFDWDGRGGTVDDIIKTQKTYYNPEYDKQTREEYEREIEAQYAEEKLWENRLMFDSETVETINRYFPLAVLVEAEKSKALPDYLRERFARAVWTRAVILDDYATAEKIAPEVLKFNPELEDAFAALKAAKTLQAKRNAALFIILKNPIFSPFVQDGFGKGDNEFSNFASDNWWCAPYEEEGTPEETSWYQPPPKPDFLTETQSAAGKNERRKLIEIGDAPKFFGDKVLEWAKRAPRDKRVPESLFIAYQANGWTKYGCGNNEELRGKILDVLKKRYPQNEWTRQTEVEPEQ